MPLLTDPQNRSCTFSLQNPGWVNNFKLRFSGHATKNSTPPSVTTHLFTGGSFDASYNMNRTLWLVPPTNSILVRRVQLSFILSGHGQMEFDPSTHYFTVNGDEFKWTSEGVAGTDMGCTTHVRQGSVQPNEHGTWYTGRNGW